MHFHELYPTLTFRPLMFPPCKLLDMMPNQRGGNCEFDSTLITFMSLSNYLLERASLTCALENKKLWYFFKISI